MSSLEYTWNKTSASDLLLKVPLSIQALPNQYSSQEGPEECCHGPHLFGSECRPVTIVSDFLTQYPQPPLPSVQFSSVTQSCLTLYDPMNCSTPGLPIHHQLPEFTQTHVHRVGDAIQPFHPLLSPFPLAPNPSQHQSLFQWVSSLHQVVKYWSFSFSINLPNEHSGLISFRMDWLDLLAVQGTLKSLLQHHSSEASILWCSAFFMVQLSHPYMTTGKTIALTRQTFVGKVMSLLFNMLFRLVITFSQGANVLISWLQSPSAVILELAKIKPDTVSLFPYLFAMKWWDRMSWS